jgi:hypothetical protein
MWSDILHSPPAVAAIIAAILALFSGVLGPYVQYRIGRRQAAAAQTALMLRCWLLEMPEPEKLLRCAWHG